MEKNEIIEYKKIQEKYPKIARLAIAVKPPRYDYIGLYTTKIEKDKDKEKLEQWIQYWIEINPIQASIVISKLRAVQQEKKEEYKKEIIKMVMRKKEYYFELIMVLLYLEEWDKIEIVVRYLIKLKTKIKNLQKKYMSTQDKIINVSEIMYINKRQKKSFQREILGEKTSSLEKDYLKVKLNNNVNLKKEVISKFYREIKENMNCFKSEDDKEKIQKNILELEKILGDEKIYINSNLIEILTECMENIKSNGINQLYKVVEETKGKLKEISKDETEELVGNEEIELRKIIINVNRELLEVSNYELIFRFLKVFVDIKKYGLIKNEIRKFSKVNKKNNKEVIKQIASSFFRNKQIINCFDFLEKIKATNYMEYLPTDYYTVEECLEKIIEDHSDYYYYLIIYRNLFIQKNLNKYKTKCECILEWMKIIELRAKSEIEIEKAEIISIIEMLDTEGLQILEKAEIKEKLKYIKNRKKDKACLPVLRKLTSVLNKILIESTMIVEKENKIRKLKYINSFAYDEINNYEYWANINYEINKSSYNWNESIQLFKNLIENAETSETQSIIYIYMNTHLKAIYPIEKVIKLLISKNMKNVFENIEKYRILAKLEKVGQTGNKYRVLLECVYNLNRTIVNLEPIKVDKNEKNICEVKITGYKEITNEFIYEIELKNKIKNEEKYEQVIKKQIKFLNKFEFNNFKINDEENPFRYINNIEDEISPVYVVREKFLEEQMESKRVVINMIRKNEILKEEVIEQIEEITKEKSNAVKDIIDFYMNSCIKYIISINKFIKIIKQYKKCENIIENFKKYKYYARYISQNGEMSRVIMINQHSRFIYKGNKEKERLINGISLISFKISDYDEEKNTLICTDFEISNTLIPSEEYIKIKNILKQYIDTKEFTTLEELKEVKKIPELQKNNRKLVLSKKYVLYYYDTLMRKVLELLLNDIPNLKRFLKLIACNNIWLIEEYPVKEKKNKIMDINKIFIKTIEKEPNINDSIICYKRTFLRSIISLNDILEHIFKINVQGRKLVNEDGIVNIEQFNINFRIQKKTYENGEIVYSIYRNTSEHKRKISQPVKIKVINSKNDNEISEVKAISYNVITGIINCEKI